jgi:2-(1,2-epoxy-1,2-dihydrophenyl)acetyl-CoA isomerase
MVSETMDEELQAIRVDVVDGLAHIILIDGARGNPIDGRFCREYAMVANALSSRSDLRAILLSAEGKAFSYGGDVALFVANLDELPGEIKRWTTDLHSGIARFQRMDAPMVTAVHGVCAGGMAAIVAGSDIVVGSPAARFVAAYAGIGYSCDASASVTLSRRMGLARARRYLLCNETLDADAAQATGLVDILVEADALFSTARDLAERFAKGPTRAYGEIRRLLLSATDQPLETQLELEAQALARAAGTQDAREGLTAFHEKRRPQFVGR